MIVNAGGGGALTGKVTRLFFGGATAASTTALAIGSAGVGMAADTFGDANLMMSQGISSTGANRGYFEDKVSGR